jgi:hypothetical protein
MLVHIWFIRVHFITAVACFLLFAETAGDWGAEMAAAVAPRMSPSDLLCQYSNLFSLLPLGHRQQLVLELQKSGQLEKLLVSCN